MPCADWKRTFKVEENMESFFNVLMSVVSVCLVFPCVSVFLVEMMPRYARDEIDLVSNFI